MFRARNELKNLWEMSLKGDGDGRGLSLGREKHDHFTAVALVERWGNANVVLYVLRHITRRHKNKTETHPRRRLCDQLSLRLCPSSIASGAQQKLGSPPSQSLSEEAKPESDPTPADTFTDQFDSMITTRANSPLVFSPRLQYLTSRSSSLSHCR